MFKNTHADTGLHTHLHYDMSTIPLACGEINILIIIGFHYRQEILF